MRTVIRLTPVEVKRILTAHFKKEGKIPADVACGWSAHIARETHEADIHFSVWFEEEIPDDSTKK